MKKTLLLATVATVAFAMNANAGVLTPYVSAKLSAAKLDVNQSGRAIETGMNVGTEVTRSFQSYDDSKRVWGTSFAAGVSYGLEGGAIRTELEWQRNTAARMNNTYAHYYGEGDGEAGTSKTKIKTHAYMLNAYYDFDTCTKFTPYVGAGIGLAKTKIARHGDTYDGPFMGGEGTVKHTGIAWQIGAGIAYALNDNVSVDVGYRYIDYGKFKDSLVDEDWGIYRTSYETTANELYAGLRYSF